MKYGETVDRNDEIKIGKLRNVVLPFSIIKDKEYDKNLHHYRDISGELEYK
jgi:hypothetical protein